MTLRVVPLPWMIILLVSFLIITGCVVLSGNEATATGGSQPSPVSQSPPTTPLPEATPQIASPATSAPTPGSPTVTPTPSPTRVSCGSSSCPTGWSCCGQICYDPAENPNLYCKGGTLRQTVSEHTCADIDCRELPCCDDYLRGPTCYNPVYFRCVAWNGFETLESY